MNGNRMDLRRRVRRGLTVATRLRRSRPARLPADLRFVQGCYRRVLGRRGHWPDLLADMYRLQVGDSRTSVALDLLHSPEYGERQVAACADLLREPADDAFLEAAYRRLLGRPADPSGLRYYAGVLAGGGRRADVLRALSTADEHVNPRAASLLPLPRLVQMAPSRFREVVSDQGEPVRVFHATAPADFDWLEAAI